MDEGGRELTAQDLWSIFDREYGIGTTSAPQHQVLEESDRGVKLAAEVRLDGRGFKVHGTGNGPIDAFVEGLGHVLGQSVRVLDYHEHAVASGANARAVAYLELRVGDRTLFGVGMDANIVSASLKAILSGVQRAGVFNKEANAWQTS
jgi:2-isopropylmalate synthase